MNELTLLEPITNTCELCQSPNVSHQLRCCNTYLCHKCNDENNDHVIEYEYCQFCRIEFERTLKYKFDPPTPLECKDCCCNQIHNMIAKIRSITAKEWLYGLGITVGVIVAIVLIFLFYFVIFYEIGDKHYIGKAINATLYTYFIGFWCIILGYVIYTRRVCMRGVEEFSIKN